MADDNLNSTAQRLASHHRRAVKQARLLAALPGAIHASKRQRKAQELGQNCLFGAEAVADELPNAEALVVPTLVEMAQREREVLGFYFSINPFDLFAWPAHLPMTPTSEIVACTTNKQYVLTGGVISTKIIKIDKNKHPYTVINIMDLHGSMCVMLFGTAHAQLPDIEVGDAIMVEGSIDTTRGENQVKGQRVRKVPLRT